MSVEDFIISAFCLVDDTFNEICEDNPLRKRGFKPKLSDPEIITMEIVGEFLQIDNDRKIWLYFKTHWALWFPALGSRSNFARQASNLWKVKQMIQADIAPTLNAENDTLHMADGFPLPICQFKRAYFSRLFKSISSYGYCASKGEMYYGFKGNLVINSTGIISNITFTPANIDERESLWEIVDNISGLLLADKALLGDDFQKQLRSESGINLQTPMRQNMQDPRAKDAGRWLVSTRRLVETVIGQLTDRFNIEKNWARDCWHFTIVLQGKFYYILLPPLLTK